MGKLGIIRINRATFGEIGRGTTIVFLRRALIVAPTHERFTCRLCGNAEKIIELQFLTWNRTLAIEIKMLLMI